VPLSQQLRPFSSKLASSLTAISPQTGSINHITSVLAECPSVPYVFFNWTASVTKYYDAFGSYPRGDAGIGLFSASPVKDPRVVDEAACSGGAGLGGVPSNFVNEP
jgi:hypothetical protein